MRTMLISLILICSLAQLASTQSTSAVQRDELKECTKLYACFVPAACISGLPVNEGSIDAVKDYTPIFPNCPAAIRFHLYAKHHAHVIIEGLEDSTTSIEFTREGRLKTDDPNNRIAKFSCTVNDEGLLYGEYSIDLIKGSKENLKYVRTHKDPPKKFERKSRIKCEFEVKLGKSYDIFTSYPDRLDTVQFHIDNTEKTIADQTPFTPLPNCNPANIKFLEEDKERKNKYEKVAYYPGKFYCKDEKNFKMQYKKNDGTKYETINKLYCKKTDLIVTDSSGNTPNYVPSDGNYDGNDDLRIRCVADVNLFCDEPPKVTGSDGPNFKAPDRGNTNPDKRAGSLTCPEDFPHLVVKDVEKPIQYAKFDCLAFGDEQFWTVNVSNTQTIRLTMDGPEVNCTNILECHLHLRIPESSVSGGDLDPKTFVPKCSEKGILFARQKEGDKNVEIETPYCNKQSGKFEYKVKGGQKKVVNEKTKFECTYPQEKDENMHVGAAETAKFSAIAVGIAAAICAGIIGLIIFFAARKHRLVKEKQRQQEQKELENGQDVWIRYCMDEEEKKNLEAKIKGQLDDEVTPPAGDDVYNWNRMLMNFQRNGMDCIGANKDGKIKQTDKAAQMNVKDLDQSSADDHSKWLIARFDFNDNKIERNVWTTQLDPFLYEKNGDMYCRMWDYVKNLQKNWAKQLEKKMQDRDSDETKIYRRDKMGYAPNKLAAKPAAK